MCVIRSRCIALCRVKCITSACSWSAAIRQLVAAKLIALLRWTSTRFAVSTCHSDRSREISSRNMTQLPATPIRDALQSTTPIDSIQVQGWVRTRRDSKDFSFIELNDGSSLRNLQIIAKDTLPNYPAVQRLTTGASITVTGALVPSQGKAQKWELVA